MKRLILFLAVLLSMSWTLGRAQPTSSSSSSGYQPAVPPPSMGVYGGGGFGYLGGGVGSTAAGSALTGMSNVISAKGDAALSTSAAAVNMTQAQKQELQNRQLYTDTYFQMRETNRQAREAERRPRPTAERLARIAREDAPKPLSPSEVNEVTGKLAWPAALQSDDFKSGRSEFEKLFVSYSQLGALNYADQTKARKVINDMNKQLKSQIRTLPPTDYVPSKNFLEGLMFTTCKSRLG